jgi:hypothetical protein
MLLPVYHIDIMRQRRPEREPDVKKARDRVVDPDGRKKAFDCL